MERKLFLPPFSSGTLRFPFPSTAITNAITQTIASLVIDVLSGMLRLFPDSAVCMAWVSIDFSGYWLLAASVWMWHAD